MAAIVKLIGGLPLLLLLPGYLCLRLLRARGRIPSLIDFSEWLFLSVLVSVCITTWLGLLLAELSLFSLSAILAVTSGVSLALIIAAGRSALVPPRPTAGALLLLLLFACLGVIFYTPPYEYVLGNWDPGTYVNSGANLAKTGAILIHDRVLKEIPPSDRPLFYYTRLLPQRYEGGMAIADSDKAIVSPHFYHAYTVWIALFHALGGLQFSLWVNALFGILALAAFSLASRELAGRNTAFLAALFMVFSAAEIWSVRFPTAEIIAQFLIFSGLFCLFRYQSEGRGFWAILAGVCFAEACLSIFTAVVILPLLILVFFWRNWNRWQRRDALFLIPLAAGLVHLSLQNITVCRSYAERQLEVLRSEGLTPPLLVSSAVAFLIALLMARMFLRNAAGRIQRLFRRSGFQIALGALALCLFIFAYLVRPMLNHAADARNVRELGWFIYPVSAGRRCFPLGLCIALAGALLFIREGFDQKRGSFFLIATLTCALFMYKKMIFPSYLWAVRRYVPIVFPSCIFFMAYAIGRLGLGTKRRTLAAAAITLILMISMLLGYTRLVMPTDYAGTIAFLKRLAAPLDRGGLYVCEGSGIASPLDYTYGLDVLQISDQTPDKCRGVERVMGSLLDRGRRLYYISRGGWPMSRALDFVPSFETPLETDHLEYSVGAFPRRRVPVSVTARVFRVEKLGASPEANVKSRMLDIGEDCFCLIKGFHGLTVLWEKEGRKSSKRWARWTSREAELLIPTFGARADLTLTIRASAGRERPIAPVPVTVFIEGKKVGEIALGRSWEERSLSVPSAALPRGRERAIMRLQSPVWRTTAGSMSAQPADLGICLDWVKIEIRGQT